MQFSFKFVCISGGLRGVQVLFHNIKFMSHEIDVSLLFS